MTQPTLYIVATPIGNLSDFSSRAQDILSSVSCILCEDTRHTGKLLHHFGIKNHLESLHVHNEKDKVNSFLEKLITSSNPCAALVSDAGTPAICDPGAYLVAAAHTRQVQVVSVPGPSSMTCALAASGFIQPRTLFSGFLSKTRQEQVSEFKVWAQASPCIAVFFESPRRVKDTLQNFMEFLEGEYSHIDINCVEICFSREISKKFEEHKRVPLPQALSFYSAQEETLGEFVVCVNLNKMEKTSLQVSLEFAAKEAKLMSLLYELPLKQCCKQLADKYGFVVKDIYAASAQLSV